MRNQLLNCLRFIDPMHTAGPVEYARDVLAPLHGWTNARLFFGGVGDLDWARIEENLRNREYVPENEPIIFDLEREDCTMHFPDYSKIDNPSTGAMQTGEHLLDLAQYHRPDCPSTFYSFTTPDWWIKFQTVTDIAAMRKLMRFSAPVLRRQSFICPQFYITKSYDPRRTLQWIHQEIRLIRECQPFAEIVPMFSPVWYEALCTPKYGQQDFQWTPDAVKEIAIPADYQRNLLTAMKAEGITKIAAFSDGWMPWGLAGEMMKPLIDWMK